MADLVKSVMLRIVSDDGDTQEKLDRIAEKADELGRKNPDIKVKVDAWAAQAQLAVLKKELKDVGSDADHTSGSADRLGRSLAGIKDKAEDDHGVFHDLGNVFSDLANVITGGGGGSRGDSLQGALGDGSAAAEEMGGSISGLGETIALLIPALAAAMTAITPFLVSFTIGGAAVAGFAALAVPEIEKVWTAVGKGKAAIDALPPAERALAGPIEGLKKDFGDLEKAIRPEALSAFGTGLKILNTLMPTFRTLVVAAGKGVDAFLKTVQSWLTSPSGQKFLSWLRTDAPHAVNVFLHGLWDLIKVFGEVTHFVYDEGVTMDQNFHKVVRDITVAVDVLRETWVNIGHTAETVFNDISNFVSTALDTVRENLAGSGHNVESWADTVGQYVMDVARFFGQLPGKVTGALSALPGDLYRIGLSVIDGLLHGIESAASSVISYVGHLASDISGAFGKLLGIFSPSRVFFTHGQMIGLGLVQGMDSTHGQVMAAAGRLAAATSFGSHGAGGGAGAGGIVIEFHAGSNPLSQQFFSELASGIRTRGGSKDIITKKVVFA